LEQQHQIRNIIDRPPQNLDFQANPRIISHDNNHVENQSRGIVLPSSFLGSRAWATSEVADSLAICRSKGKPSFFITITTNPNWPEIVERLQPGQSASDISVIVCRVFKARMQVAIQAIKQYIGSLVYIVRVVEFQKRGLPHAHIVVKVYTSICISID
jgi:hypothetical protein